MKPRENLVGKRSGRLTAIKPAEDRVLLSGRHLTMWTCLCDCGKTVTIRASDFKSGKVISCGCYRAQNTGNMSTTHGATRGRKATHLYSVWAGMISRCTNKNSKVYKYYGGRGVSVCDSWKESFSEFEKWAYENGYKQGLSIDRIDSNGDYCPGNCRWATGIQQANNTRKNRFITAYGKRKTIAEWAMELNVGYNSLYYRLSKNGWSIEKAVMET